MLLRSPKLTRTLDLYNGKAPKLFSVVLQSPRLLLCWLVVLALLVGCATKSSQTFAPKTSALSVQVEAFRNDKGEAIVSLFSVNGGFPDDMERAWKTLRLKIDSGRIHALFTDVPHGEYALCVLHDEDGDSQMRRSWLGQPLEGFGFSGRPEYSFGPPDFAGAAFLMISEAREIVVRMRYDTVRKEKQNERRTGQGGKL
jgi:uncharacterized protein (DUF2141 family)